MNLFVYSDESGVFDYVHNDIFVFGGLIFLSKESRDVAIRKYIHAEKSIRYKYPKDMELKASLISNKDKGKLYRSLNNEYKFGVVVKQKELLKSIFGDKKSKQRYLDYAFKRGLKAYFVRMITEKIIDPLKIERVYVFVDEHSTATNGRYELKESLEEEFRRGRYNYFWNYMYPPIFPNLIELNVEYCDSKSKHLVRASDIVANNMFSKAILENRSLFSDEKTNIIKLPE